ncbi:MAG: T9SS type A sorting domain-containing protein, partial [Bacteroidota bacterium]
AVDMRVQIAETSAADSSGISSSTINNGTYVAGYKILTADRSIVVYEPPSAGVRFRFDSQPSNTYVARVFAPGSDLSTHIYTITNGDGADYINTTRVVSSNFWNTLALPVGNYSVMVFAQDTRALADTDYVPIQVTRQDVIAPAIPRLHSVLNDSINRITVRWYPNTDPDLLGYRLYYSTNGINWSLRENETRLGPASTSISYVLGVPGMLFFRLAAVDSASPANVSGFSDVYGIRFNTSSIRTLIVDGFDRTQTSGSWHEPSHPFAVSHGQSIPGDFGTCANEAVIEGGVSLQLFNGVDWLLGDESVADTTFTSAEQAAVMSYLRNGGKLFVSGSEVAYNLDRPTGPTQADRDFLHNFLKARYAGDDANEYTVNGATATLFQDVSLRYGVVVEGSPYEEDYPDFVTQEPGAHVVLHYGAVGNPVYAGVAYRGTFPGGTSSGGVIYMGFPFETITMRATRDTLMRRVYQYLNEVTGVEISGKEWPDIFELKQNYPNPFNPSTKIGFQIPASPAGGSDYGLVLLKVYDVLGREAATLVNEVRVPGQYSVTWDASGFASGVYFYKLEAGDYVAVRKLVVMK